MRGVRWWCVVRVYRCDVGKSWRMYSLIEDGSVHLLEMVPASWAGWNVKRYSVQGAHDWPDMDEAEIVKYYDKYRVEAYPVTSEDEIRQVVAMVDKRRGSSCAGGAL